MEINLEMKSIVNKMNKEALAMLILTKACSMIEGKKTDVIELLNICSLVTKSTKDFYEVSATKLYNAYLTVVLTLKDVSDDGGIVEICTLDEMRKKEIALEKDKESLKN